MLVSPCHCLGIFQDISFRTFFFILHWGTFSNSDFLNFGIFFQAITEEEWTLPYSVLTSCCFSLKHSAVSAWLWLRNHKAVYKAMLYLAGFVVSVQPLAFPDPFACLSSLAVLLKVFHLPVSEPLTFSLLFFPHGSLYSVSLSVPLCTC